MAVKSAYKTCPKCGNTHSTLVRHKCFKKGEAPPPPESGGGEGEDGDEEREGKGKPTEGDGQSGEGEGQGDGQGDGSGEGEGEGQGEGEGEGEGMPEAKPPEPEAPPVAVVVTVLKFAALCAQSAENGAIVVEVTEPGLFVYGSDGDERVATAIIPWGEFEKRSTLDGEFMVRDAIKGVDAKLIEAEATEAEPLPWGDVLFVDWMDGDATSSTLTFANGAMLQPYSRNENGTYRVGVPAGMGGFDHGDWAMMHGGSFARRCHELQVTDRSGYEWMIDVDAYGRSVKDPSFQVVVRKD